MEVRERMSLAFNKACEVYVGDRSRRLKFGDCVITQLLNVNNEYGERATLHDAGSADSSADTGTFLTIYVSYEPVLEARPRIFISHSPMGESYSSLAGPLRFGHARACPCDTWRPVQNDSALLGKELRVASCVLVRDESNNLLLTRRASDMRTFGGCWVFPGGRVDPGESLAGAALREVLEETGVNVDPASLELLCGWESCFPSRPPGKAHYIVLFFTGAVDHTKSTKCASSNEYELTLNPDESDAAIWVDPKAHRDRIDSLFCNHSSEPQSQQRIPFAPVTESKSSELSVAADEVFDLFSDDSKGGIGRGHLFALQQYLSHQKNSVQAEAKSASVSE